MKDLVAPSGEAADRNQLKSPRLSLRSSLDVQNMKTLWTLIEYKAYNKNPKIFYFILNLKKKKLNQ